jgi:hypothetical protein
LPSAPELGRIDLVSTGLRLEWYSWPISAMNRAAS